LSSNTFIDATAYSGGGVYWNFVEPEISAPEGSPNRFVDDGKSLKYHSLKFEECEAEIYGPQIAAPARELTKI
jgi:hypothetical protein